MDVKEFRRQFEADLASDASGRPKPRLGFAFSVGAGKDLDSEIFRNLKVLADVVAEKSERAAALNGLKAARFTGPRFGPYRVAFLDVLRRILAHVEDPGLRLEAAEVLASEKDRPTQELLRRGLENPSAALVPAAEALEFLGYDDHEDAGRLALAVLQSGTDLHTREAALRVLGSTAGASDVLAAIMTDKSEPRSLRALGAVGLRQADPARFVEVAGSVILDADDYPEVRATSLGALTSSRELRAEVKPPVAADIRSLASEALPQPLLAAVERFIEHDGQ